MVLNENEKKIIIKAKDSQESCTNKRGLGEIESNKERKKKTYKESRKDRYTRTKEENEKNRKRIINHNISRFSIRKIMAASFAFELNYKLFLLNLFFPENGYLKSSKYY